ncbi:lysylphosphatidylglycerol synthase transmembrane domain-containing protein [Pontibacter sp. G13]|uniref:lysylphosphatidylglycerol synthase transmembrane domain-containing protein n=1 Tax=Pontibacter sp. G13 TaxID=3074898 RepID=UPI00288B5B41|nr:lysylphosphatidylglycerol synthase transmembrane domain-containing protein [Pontibacter sp. G13]WNJ16831.1 lysylphosphatidylglycerol synthase transmembrane domain-containing protein [Pontibacter sp. G13]
MPDTNQDEALKEFRSTRLIWPILIGVAILGYTIYQLRQDGINPFTDIDWNLHVFGWIALGFVCMAIRDIGYIWRMRLLTDEKLNWRSAIEVTLLWEFASALSPSIVGGSAVAIFMLMREKISAGRSTAIVFITIFLDELFYIAILPIVLLIVDHHQIFGPVNGVEAGTRFGTGLIVGFWIAYFVLMSYTSFLAFALFFNPAGTNRVLRKVVHWKIFSRWQESGEKMADELMIASREFRSKSFGYWTKAWISTCLAWLGRYLVLNCVLAAFNPNLSFHEHVVAFARQAVMFVVMIVSPTPGSSGIAEGVFGQLFAEFSPDGVVLILANVWRLITYYPYLFIGIIVFPIWLRRVMRRKK